MSLQIFEGDCFSVFATPQMINLLIDPTLVQAEVTFPGIPGFPYLMNMVVFTMVLRFTITKLLREY